MRNFLSDQPLPGETRLGHFLRDAVVGLLLGLPWMLTPFIIAGALKGASEPPRPLQDALKNAPPITAQQHEAYCKEERRELNLPWWHDPACR